MLSRNFMRVCVCERELSHYVTEQKETRRLKIAHDILPHGSASALPEVFVGSRAVVVCRRAGSAGGFKSLI